MLQIGLGEKLIGRRLVGEVRILCLIFSYVLIFITGERGFDVKEISGFPVCVMDGPERPVFQAESLFILSEGLKFDVDLDSQIDARIEQQFHQTSKLHLGIPFAVDGNNIFAATAQPYGQLNADSILNTQFSQTYPIDLIEIGV